MKIRVVISILMIWVCTLPAISVSAREGDTLLPITIDAPSLETYPDNLLTENDFKAIDGRIAEARNSGVPLAVRIVDLSQDDSNLPMAVRQLRNTDLSQPISQNRATQITEAWIESEPIETAPEAGDGILLLVLVPSDRTQTQALWWIGPNALPLNSLTAANISATLPTMNEQFAQGNMPNGVYTGLQEFGYNIQFGVPERLERTTLQNALHTAMSLLAIVTALTGVAIPVIAWILGRRMSSDGEPAVLSPWEAAALHQGRVSPAIPAAMLLEAVHTGDAEPLSNGGLRINTASENPAIDTLKPFATDGIVPRAAMLEVDGITHSVHVEIEERLAKMGAFTSSARTDRTWILLAMGITTFLIALGVVPVVVSMSAAGIYGIGIGLVGIALGWWWLSARSYTTTSDTELLSQWLDSASPDERNRFDLVVHQTYLIERTGGPNVSPQMKLVRHLRGLGAH